MCRDINETKVHEKNEKKGNKQNRDNLNTRKVKQDKKEKKRKNTVILLGKMKKKDNKDPNQLYKRKNSQT